VLLRLQILHMPAKVTPSRPLLDLSDTEIGALVQLILQKRKERLAQGKADAQDMSDGKADIDIHSLADEIDQSLAKVESVAKLSSGVGGGQMVIDIKWKTWKPRRVKRFMTRLGGFAALYASNFEEMEVAGIDLSNMTDAGLEGIGVTNGWHRIKILSAIQVMIKKSEQERVAAERLRKQQHKKSVFDLDGDGYVTVTDFANLVYGLLTGFTAFAFNKDVQALVVGIMMGGGLQTLANSMIVDLIAPLIISPWAGHNLGNIFVIMKPSCASLDRTNATVRTTCDFRTVEEAQAAGAATLNHGRFWETLLDFLFLAFFVFLLFKVCKYVKELATRWYEQQHDAWNEWQRQNQHRLSVDRGEPIDD